MSEIAFLPTPIMTTEIAKTQQSALVLSPEKMVVARAKNRFVIECQNLMTDMHWTLNKAAGHLAVLIAVPSHPLHSSALDFGKSNKPIGKAQLVRWFNSHKKAGIAGLVDQRKGKKKLDKGWEHRATALYQRPMKPSFNNVMNDLIDEGFEVNYHEVRRYLNTLPTTMTTFSNKRLGAKFNRNNNLSYHELDDSNLPVGFVYQGDGHEMDVWVAHPNDPKVILRPELTAWIDAKSRYITGYWVGEVERSIDTIYALSYAIKKHNHINAYVHVDNGAGYKSHVLSDENTGFYDRCGITQMYAIPGNSKGKGRIERWFKTLEMQFGKSFDTYCGKDMASDELFKIERGVKKGTYQLPSLEEFKQRLAVYIDKYNNTIHSKLDGKTPAQLWATLENVEMNLSLAELVLPIETRQVRRGGISHQNRLYRNPELLDHEGKTVQVQFDMHNDSLVQILSEDGVWICDATLNSKPAYLSDSRIIEASKKRLASQLDRLDKKKAEKERRATLTLGVEPDLKGLEILNQPQLGVQEFGLEDQGASTDKQPTSNQDSSIVIDITDTSWADKETDYD